MFGMVGWPFKMRVVDKGAGRDDGLLPNNNYSLASSKLLISLFCCTGGRYIATLHIVYWSVLEQSPRSSS
jgi:hypothetical protein